MTTRYIGTIAATALALTGLSAHAGCIDPRVAAGAPAENHVAHVTLPRAFFSEGERGGPASIVGTWFVSYTLGGEAYIQWHSDGTEWENINHPVSGGNICMGSWKQTGRYTYVRHHVGWIYTDDAVTNYFIEDETAQLSPGGNSYTGVDTFTIYDLSGNAVMGPLSGTASATRF